MSERDTAWQETAADPVEALLAECLDRDEAEWPAALGAACAAHPEHAEALRRRFALVNGTAAERGTLEAPRRLGDFELRERLGGGGMGVVHVARDVRLQRDVAIKLLRPELLWFEGSRQRFQREVEAVARLQHPGIVPIHSYGEQQGVPYYAMERVRGVPLDELLAALGDRDPATLSVADVAALLAQRTAGDVTAATRADRGVLAAPRGTWVAFCAAVVQQAADAIAHAHAHGILHRDVKPSNLMLSADGRVQLLDFGLAVVAGASRLTDASAGGEIGSPPYMAPEQLRGEAIGERTDVYGLGVTLYELVSLHCPYLRATREATRRAILDADRPALRTLRRGTPWEIETICAVAMEPDAARRYPSAAALRDDLARFLRREPIVARRPSRLRRARRWVERHPARATAIVLGFALTAGVPSALLVQQRAANRVLQAALDEYDQLADEIVVGRLRDEAEALWPALPEQVPAMQRWLAETDAVLARLPKDEQALAALRQQALPYAADDRRADEQRRAQIGERIDALQERSARLAQLGVDGTSSAVLAQVAEEVGRLQAQESERTWRFAAPRDAWRHGELTALVDDLRRLRPLRDEVEARLQRATTVTRRSIDAHAEDWQRVRAALAADPRFAGVAALAPQVGMVPLGTDPHSGLQEFAWLPTGTAPERDGEDGRLRLTAGSGVVLVLLPGGTFTMGAADDEPFATDAERPQNQVTLAPFFAGKHEVTQAQWTRLLDDNPSALKPGDAAGPDGIVTPLHPVTNVSWDDAQRFALRAGLALPTEAQWEYACRAGTAGPWCAPLDEAVNLCDATVAEAGITVPVIERDLHDGWLQAAPIGSFAPNAFGLHDTMGNVMEWCRDGFVSYAVAPAKGPDGLRAPPQGPSRVARGGHWGSGRGAVRSAARLALDPAHRDPTLGLRVVRAIEP